MKTKIKSMVWSVIRWFDSDFAKEKMPVSVRQDWVRILPFAMVHLVCFCVIWVGWSWIAVGTAIAFYILRMFAITGFYHRYFSHRSFSTSRFVQFLFAFCGAAAVQRGALWWAANHRYHHRYSDQKEDIHSPRQNGIWWAHMGWITSGKHFTTKQELIPDLTKYPELLFLNRFDILVPVLLGVFTFFFGMGLKKIFPGLGTSGPQMLIWGFFISTVVLFHATSTINSLSHLFGAQRFQTGDDSKNNFYLALLTFGEGWHNNHHHYQGATRQGFYWWEVDLTYYTLTIMSWFGLIWDLRPVPVQIYENARTRI